MKLPDIENALQNIQMTCQQKLEKLYPSGIPEEIHTRYLQEMAFLETSDYVNDFELFRLFSDEAKKCSTIINMRGTVTGSFIYFLLGNNCFNPLEPHYYCSECGYYEKVKTHLFGIDLPIKKCPTCGNEIIPDGFNLPPESVWGNDGKKTISFDHNVNSEFLPFARRILQMTYPENNIVPWGMFQIDPTINFSHPDQRVFGIGLAGYAILPVGNTIEDYPDLISYLENGDVCLTGMWELREHMLKPIRLYSLEYLDDLLELQRTTGIYAYELTAKELRNITWSNIYNTTVPNDSTRALFHEYKPKTFKHMTSLNASTYNAYAWKEPSETIDIYDFQKMISSEPFKKYPCFTREDFFDYLLDAGVERALAFDAAERIRKGHAHSIKNYKEQFFSLPIPDEIKEIAKNYKYAFPRSHVVEYMLIYARLAYYAKVDGRAFGKVMFGKR